MRDREGNLTCGSVREKKEEVVEKKYSKVERRTMGGRNVWVSEREGGRWSKEKKISEVERRRREE